MKEISFETLKGKTIVSIIGLEDGSDVVKFECSDGSRYKMYHEQDCCEGVAINDVCGCVEDMLNREVLIAEERQSDGESNDWGDSSTWTFYVLATVKGYLDIRWLGQSNGYYSESVSFVEDV